MLKPKEQIIADINAYMKSVGGTNNQWYVGIATDAVNRLFIDHKVSEEKGSWIWRRSSDHQTARDIEALYHAVGCDGGPGGGDDDTECVYAYLKTPQTVQ